MVVEKVEDKLTYNLRDVCGAPYRNYFPSALKRE